MVFLHAARKDLFRKIPSENLSWKQKTFELVFRKFGLSMGETKLAKQWGTFLDFTFFAFLYYFFWDLPFWFFEKLTPGGYKYIPAQRTTK